MPTLNLSTNVPVDAVVAADILKDCSKAVARIIGKPESVRLVTHPTRSAQCLGRPFLLFINAGSWLLDWSAMGSLARCSDERNISPRRAALQYVMVSINGSVPMSFAASEEPAAYGELVSIGGIGPGVNGKLSAAVAEVLETKLSVSRSRFYIKFDDVQVLLPTTLPCASGFSAFSSAHLNCVAVSRSNVQCSLSLDSCSLSLVCFYV
jgi:phenylpyruvate tautomerase